MFTLVSVNGIRNDGEKNTDLLVKKVNQILPDSNIFDFSYSKIDFDEVLFKLRHRNHLSYKIAEKLIGDLEDDYGELIIIAHSFGGLITLRAIELGLKIHTAFLFSPASDNDIYINCRNIKNKLFVIYNPFDLAILAGSGLLFHDFGPMGRKGYLFPNDKIINISACKINNSECRFSWKNLKNFYHNNYFFPENINKWVNFIFSQLS